MAISLDANNSYDPFVMDQQDIHALLQEKNSIITSKTANIPADITFGCADIKYNNGSFKIVECGDAIYMSLRTHDVIMNKKQQRLTGPYWGILWHYLMQFRLPIWHVQDAGPANALALDELKKLGGNYVGSWQHLANNAVFQEAAKKTVRSPSALADYAGIIVYRARQERNREPNTGEYQKFKAQHPNFIYVNANTRDFLKRKDNTYRLFNDAGLGKYIPTSIVASTLYDPSLAHAIRKALGTVQQYIIKPVYSSLSIGVNTVASEDLESFLELILLKKDAIPKNSGRGLHFWRNHNPPHFIASEYAPSQTLYKDGKPYDPTMRVMFVMHHDRGSVHINVLGGFWKIPVKALNDQTATLTEKHVTIAHAGDYYSFGAMLTADDAATLKLSLAPVLAKAYEAMLLQAPSIS